MTTAAVTDLDGQRARIFTGTDVLLTGVPIRVTHLGAGLVRLSGVGPLAPAITVPSDLLAIRETSGMWTVSA